MQIAFPVLEAGLEPAQPQWPRDFKSLVSTIPPFEQRMALLFERCKGMKKLCRFKDVAEIFIGIIKK